MAVSPIWLVELKALAGGGVQMNTLFQFMSFNTTNGIANLAIEPNIGGSNNGELIFGYGFVNLSDKALKTSVRDLSEKELQETFDAVEPRIYDRIEGGKVGLGGPAPAGRNSAQHPRDGTAGVSVCASRYKVEAPQTGSQQKLQSS